ncbi:MAG TPA: hypothetical protein VFW85_04745 [Gaiellaceae bacterium]|nr:hypothetical protein [Gaiellaceae bacterium]
MIVCLGTLLSAAVGASAASHTHHRNPSGIVPPSPHNNPLAARSVQGSGDLTYHGGPVMHTNTTYAIYWVPSGFSYNNHDSTYESTINQFFSDVAADSGLSSNVYATDTQYYDTVGGGTHHITYSSSFAGSTVVTTAFPASGCHDEIDSVCLTDDQLQTEIQSVVSAQHWPQNMTTQYFLFTPKNVGSCFDASGDVCAYSFYCAYHNYFNTSDGPIIYANQPWTANWPSRSSRACDEGQYPNSSDADPTINVTSHEHNEAITDPDTTTGWYDRAGYENGDKCAWTFGSVSGSNGRLYNETINGHHYFLQEEYNNAAHNCVQSLPAAPENVAAPAITGTATVGQTLTATAGTWNNSPTKYTYAWQRCNSSGNNCSTSSTSGSTSTSATYALKSGDDAYTIRVSVVAKNGVGSSAAAQSAATNVVNGEPVYTTGVSLTGTATVGQTLTAHAGSWSPAPTKFSYAWQRCDSGGANCTTFKTVSATSGTAPTYKLVSADDRKTLRVTVTATNSAGTSLPQQSSATGVVNGEPINTAAPTITGATTVGQKLTADVGSWSPAATKYTYTWQRCDSSGNNCSQISGASKATYKLGGADHGHRIRVTVTAKNNAGSSDPKQSAATSLVP